MITARLEARVATARLNLLLLRVNDTTKVFKTWVRQSPMKQKNNARAKGGRSFWKKNRGFDAFALGFKACRHGTMF